SSITFDHAWVRALVPTKDGLTKLDLDPSWKFKDYQSGISIATLTDFNNDAFHNGLFDEFKYLDKTVVEDNTSSLGFRILPDTPLDFFESEMQQWLVETHPGLSLADVPYDGPIRDRVVDVLPFAPWGGGNSIGAVEEGKLSDIL